MPRSCDGSDLSNGPVSGEWVRCVPGHSTFNGAADMILSSIFGSDTAFTIGSDDMPCVTRSFASFAAAADEAGESRIFGGIHFEFDNHAGLISGREVGAYIADNLLRPRES